MEERLDLDREEEDFQEKIRVFGTEPNQASGSLIFVVVI
jgi:hypothetical protein